MRSIATFRTVLVQLIPCLLVVTLPFHLSADDVSSADDVLSADDGGEAGCQTATARQSYRILDEIIQLGPFEGSVTRLEDQLQSKTDTIGIFVDREALKLAQVSPDQSIEISLSKMPLRSALRKVLSPLGLKAVVQDDGIVITADFEALVRRGIATDIVFDSKGKTRKAIQSALNNTVTLEVNDRRLDEVLAGLSETTGIPIHIERRALEEIGVPPDSPVKVELADVSLRSALRLMLQPYDLTFMIRDEALQITTIEAAETNLVGRVYYLESLGLPRGDTEAALNFIRVVESSIVPDTWEVLGGPSTIRRMPHGRGARPAMIVSTTSDVHQMLRDMLASLRAGSLGPDPVGGSE